MILNNRLGEGGAWFQQEALERLGRVAASGTMDFMLKVKRLSPDAALPTVAHPGEDIGYDLYSCEDLTIAAHGAAGVHTGIAIEFVPAAGSIVKTRSGLARKRLVCNAGVIDAGYRGEVIVLMENLGND